MTAPLMGASWIWNHCHAGLCQDEVGETVGRIAVPHVYQELNDKRDFFNSLVAFERLGDPCGRMPPHPDPEVRKNAEDECVKVVLGYRDLPLYATTRCKGHFLFVECKSDLPGIGSWYCGARMGWSGKNLVGLAKYKRKEIKLSYCVGNLDFGFSDSWLPTNQIGPLVPSGKKEKTKKTVDKNGGTGETEIKKRTVMVPVAWNQDNFYIKPLKKFLEIGDSCASLDITPDSDSITNADAQCMAAIDGYKRLPVAETERCRHFKKPGCKKEPSSAKWRCGFVMEVEKTGFLPCVSKQKTIKGIAALSYCTEGLTVQTPFIPQQEG